MLGPSTEMFMGWMGEEGWRDERMSGWVDGWMDEWVTGEWMETWVRWVGMFLECSQGRILVSTTLVSHGPSLRNFLTSPLKEDTNRRY